MRGKVLKKKVKESHNHDSNDEQNYRWMVLAILFMIISMILLFTLLVTSGELHQQRLDNTNFRMMSQ